MEKVIIIRYCEIYLKGKNRRFFERLLEQNITSALSTFDCEFKRIQGRYLIENFAESQTDSIIARLKKVAGIHSMSVGLISPTSMDNIIKLSEIAMENVSGSFKVETRRADKTFEIHSLDVSREIGGLLLEKSSGRLKVDVINPETVLDIDIREGGKTLVFCGFIKGVGGMPVGSSGNGLLMVSGGIDSPVAGYMLAKRGMKVSAIHFHSFPYTGEGAKQKVIDLCKIISAYTQGIDLYIVGFTEIQEEIHEHCDESLMITLMRRFMFRITERLAKRIGAQGIITGENLGQVASQTIESITTSNAVVEMPILRPLIAFDKNEIIVMAKEIGTFETSILPFEDCCTVFLPKYPAIKPTLEEVEENESLLKVEELIERCEQKIEKYSL